MELIIYKSQVLPPIEWNAEELKKEVAEAVKKYESIVVTSDDVKDAKKDRADLRKLKDAIEDKRKEIKKQYAEPYTAFEKQVKEITSLIDKPIGIIDAQIKEVEEQAKKDKRLEIEQIFNGIDYAVPVKLEKVFNDKWLNASYKMTQIGEELREIQQKINQDVETIKALPTAFEAMEIYKETLDLNRALSEAQRMADIAKAKEEAKKEEEPREEAPKEEPKKEPEKVEKIIERTATIKFWAKGTIDQLRDLKKFMESIGLDYGDIA